MKWFIPVILLMGCSSAPVTQAHPLNAPTQYLVTDGRTSALIVDGSAGYQVVASRDGAVVAVEDDVWIYSLRETEQPEGDCACAMEAFNRGAEPEGCFEMVLKPIATLVRVRDGKTITPFAPGSSETSESSFEFKLGGVIGNSLLMSYCGSFYECGAAHPGATCEALAMDLTNGEAKDVSTVIGQIDLEAARADLIKNGAEIDDGVELSVVNARLAMSGTASYQEALIEAPSCYACSFGEWSSYTVSTWQKVSAAEELPAPVAAYFKAFPGTPIWSEVTPGNRNVVEQAFAQ